MLNFIIFLCFGSSLFILYNLLKYIFIRQSPISRIKKYTSIEAYREEKKEKNVRRDFKAGLAILSKGIGESKLLEGYKRSVQRKLVRGHVLLKAEEFITLNLIITLGLGLFGFLLRDSLLVAVILSVLGWFIPSIFLGQKISRRMKLLNDQLGDAIMLISNSLKAGYSFFQAVDIVAREMNGPISEEFAHLQKEINLGVTTEKALENMGERVQSDDLDLIVTAVMIQRQVGGNLAEVMDNISSTIRDRVKIKADVRTVTAQGRMSGMVIALLPPILCVLISVVNRGYISELFTNPIGIAILVFSAIMELIGIYFISKIVKIEV